MTNRIIRDFSRHFKWIDLGKVRAHRIYDLLGIYDRAAGLVTSDTSTMHLAPGSKIPYIGFTVDSWCQSVPKGNVLFKCGYNSTPNNMDKIMSTIAVIYEQTTGVKA